MRRVLDWFAYGVVTLTAAGLVATLVWLLVEAPIFAGILGWTTAFWGALAWLGSRHG